jgi:hypothetical protein
VSDPFAARVLAERLADCRARGERVAVAEIVAGPGTGRRLLVWPAGHTFGDLGWPRLNQRAALYAEQLFERGARAPANASKRFDVPGEGDVEVRFELSMPA